MRKLILLTCIILITSGLVFFAFTRNLFFDDSYMFIRYAMNIIRHNNFGWNFTDPTYGCTSLAYVISNFLLIKIGLLSIFNQATYLMLHSLAYFIVALFILHKTIFKILSDNRKYIFEVSALIIIYLLLIPITRKNALTGMDTSMALFANMLLIYSAICFVKNESNRNFIAFILSSYFSFFVRPDNGIYSIIFPLLFLIYNNKKSYLIRFFLLLGFIYAIDLSIKYYYFGNVMPIPYYVKSGSFYSAYLGIEKWNTLHYLANFIFYMSPFILISILSYDKKLLKNIVPFIIPLLLTWIFFLKTIQIMGYDSRLFIPSVPFIIIPFLILYNNLSPFNANVKSKFFLLKGIVGSASIIAVYIILRIGGTFIYNEKMKSVVAESNKYILTYSDTTAIPIKGWWETIHLINQLIQNINQRDFVLAASEHGVISSHNLDTKILCLAGLHNINSLKEKSLNKTAINNSLLEFKPDLIWMPHNDYVNVRYNILTLDYFIDNYDFYNGIMDYGIAIKKSSKYYLPIVEFCEKTYGIGKIHPTTVKKYPL